MIIFLKAQNCPVHCEIWRLCCKNTFYTNATSPKWLVYFFNMNFISLVVIRFRSSTYSAHALSNYLRSFQMNIEYLYWIKATRLHDGLFLINSIEFILRWERERREKESENVTKSQRKRDRQCENFEVGIRVFLQIGLIVICLWTVKIRHSNIQHLTKKCRFFVSLVFFEFHSQIKAGWLLLVWWWRSCIHMTQKLSHTSQ